MDDKPQSLLYQRAYVIGFWLGRILGDYFIQVWAALKLPRTYLVALAIGFVAAYYILLVWIASGGTQ